MSHHSINQPENISVNSMVENQELFDPEEDEKINTSFSYSIPTRSMYYNSEGEASDPEKTKAEAEKVLKDANIDLSISESQDLSHEIIEVNSLSNKESVHKKTDSINDNTNNSINASIQNNVNDSSIKFSNASPIAKVATINNALSSSSSKHRSIDNKSEFDNASVIVEINEKDEEIINVDNSISSSSKDKANVSFQTVDRQLNEINEANNLKKKLELSENRISMATSGDFTFVEGDPTSQNNRMSTATNITADLPTPEKPEVTNKNLKRLTDTTSVPPDLENVAKEEINEVDKASADISNKEHKITIEDDDEEDNTCAICLIETQKPSDIENLNNDGSNETVVAPSKEDIDNYECKLHCMHKFHYSCIAQWLERSQNCPICRMEIKHYEIEAIEKRFDITIKVKEEPLPLVQPHYNNTFDFDTQISESLVRNYMTNHLPWVNFNKYFYTRFFVYLLGYFALTVYGILLVVFSFLKGHKKLFFANYVVVIILIIGFLIFVTQLLISIKRKRFLIFMIGHPASSTAFYGLVFLKFVLLFTCMNYFIDTIDTPFSLEKIFDYCVIFFFGIFMIWSCIEARHCYKMFKEEDHRIVDADVSRRNQEIVERSRREEAREREEFERNFSHLND